jgi:hypothetical protein
MTISAARQLSRRAVCGVIPGMIWPFPLRATAASRGAGLANIRSFCSDAAESAANAGVDAVTCLRHDPAPQVVDNRRLLILHQTARNEPDQPRGGEKAINDTRSAAHPH